MSVEEQSGAFHEPRSAAGEVAFGGETGSAKLPFRDGVPAPQIGARASSRWSLDLFLVVHVTKVAPAQVHHLAATSFAACYICEDCSQPPLLSLDALPAPAPDHGS